MKDGFKRLGTMVDFSRNAVMKVETVKKWIDLTAALGYNLFSLYMEDTYEIPGEPYFGHLRGRYTQEELREIASYAREKEMEIVPAIQTLGHFERPMRWLEYRALADATNILLVGDERVYELIDKMFASIKESINCKYVNVGMDEATLVGRGKYLDINGYEPQLEIMTKHLNRISEIARKYDFQLMVWGDMFERNSRTLADRHLEQMEQLRRSIPDNVTLIYWEYNLLTRADHDKPLDTYMWLKSDSAYAGSVISCIGFTPRNDYSAKATKVAMDSCRTHGVQEVLITLWGDGGGECSKFATLPALHYIAECAKGNENMEEIARDFGARFGIPYDEFLQLDLLGTLSEDATDALSVDKTLLYGDCFMGQYDCRVTEGAGKAYGDCGRRLEKWIGHPEYGYVFRTIASLCAVLEKKVELGVRTRKAYLAGDKQALSALLEDYDCVVERLETFYEAFRYQWMRENKPYGFEVQDARLGGLMQRVRHCRQRLAAYIAGREASIPELEEPVLDPSCGRSGWQRYGNSWSTMISVANV